jgi:hypothetical protein
MEADDLLQFLRRKPFVPFRVYLTTGATFEFRHPELALVNPMYVQTYVPVFDRNKLVPLGDREMILSLLHIVQIEFLELASKR